MSSSLSNSIYIHHCTAPDLTSSSFISVPIFIIRKKSD